jgi:hypothetical protein
MSMMYDLVAKQGNLTMSTAENSVNSVTKEQHAQELQEQAALKQQEAAEAQAASGGGLWGEIGHAFLDVGKDLLEGNVVGACIDPIEDSVNIVDNPNFPEQLADIAPQLAEYVGIAAAIVGAAALTVCTGGVGGAVVAAVVVALSASGVFVSKTQCFGKDSAYVSIGLDVAATVVSCGAAAGTTISGAAQTAVAVSDIAAGAADVGAGVSAVVTGNQQADIVDDTADVQQFTSMIARNNRMLGDLVEGMKNAQQSNRAALTVLAQASQTYGQTLTLALTTTKA